MLNSVLLHLTGAEQAVPVIRVGVALARQAEARVRGLTLVDTRGVESAIGRGAAAFAVHEHSRQALADIEQDGVRDELAQACLRAGLDFDVRRVAGDPFDVLPREARVHDLLVTSLTDASDRHAAAGLNQREAIDLLARGAQPLLVVPRRQAAVERVLLAYDGGEATGRAIRTFLGQEVFAAAEHRLLAVGENEAAARAALAEMSDYCTARRPDWELGWSAGKLRRVLPRYAEKWQADLIVLGVERGNSWLRRLLGEVASDVLNNASCGLYAAA